MSSGCHQSQRKFQELAWISVRLCSNFSKKQAKHNKHKHTLLCRENSRTTHTCDLGANRTKQPERTKKLGSGLAWALVVVVPGPQLAISATTRIRLCTLTAIGCCTRFGVSPQPQRAAHTPHHRHTTPPLFFPPSFSLARLLISC